MQHASICYVFLRCHVFQFRQYLEPQFVQSLGLVLCQQPISPPVDFTEPCPVLDGRLDNRIVVATAVIVPDLTLYLFQTPDTTQSMTSVTRGSGLQDQGCIHRPSTCSRCPRERPSCPSLDTHGWLP